MSDLNSQPPDGPISPSSQPRSSDRSLSPRSIFARRSTMLTPEELQDIDSGIRYIQLNDHEANAERNFISNRLRTAKYTPINMIPKALFEQFRRFANFYFLVIACISFIDDISPSTPLANVLPLFIVVGFGFARDIYEDLKRSFEDSRQNNQQQIIMNRAPSNIQSVSKSLSPLSDIIAFQLQQNQLDPDIHRAIPSRNIAVGDIVHVRKGDVFPCDLILLHSSGEGGVAYVSTANLDGESNLKRTNVATPTSEITNPAQLRSLTGKIRAAKPTAALYDFEASMTLSSSQQNVNPSSSETAPLDASNLLLRGSILRNTDYIYGLAVYTGFETKVALNMRHPPSKMGTIEKKLNSVVIFLFICLSALIIGFSIAAGILQANEGKSQWYMGSLRETSATLTFARSLGTFLILFSTFIPVSLFVTLEFIRLFQALFMGADYRMKTKGQAVVARATNLNEMLGQVEHILSDKTGTLTENIMRYIACSANGKIYNVLKKKNAMHKAIKDQVGPVRELVLAMALCHSVVPEPTANSSDKDNNDGGGNNANASSQNGGNGKSNAKKLMKKMKGNHKTGIAETESDRSKSTLNAGGTASAAAAAAAVNIEVRHEGALDISNNNTTIPPLPSTFETQQQQQTMTTTNGNTPLPEYQGQSPDEVALVTSAREYGIALLRRTLDTLDIDHFGQLEQYRMLAELEFNSDRKRMSMLLQRPDGSICMYTKGADTIMLKLLDPNTTNKDLIQDHIDEFAKEGLRTLVFAKRELSREEFDNWFKHFQDARNSLENREEKVASISAEIETNLTYIATTAVEDKLQDMVPETIKFMREADVKLWVLTGDKRETAENIGYSANLLDRNMEVVHIQGHDGNEVAAQLSKVLDRHVSDNNNDRMEGGDESMIRRQSSIAGNLARRITNLGSDLGFIGKHGKRKEEKELGVIIDGKSLGFAIDEHADLFMALSDHAKVVICARVTPLQKALVVRLVKKERKSLTLAIGDGGNDVSMIQEAHVGIGIFGKEGTQAARSADYAIGEFKHLLRLLAIHGRYSAVRTSGTINLSFYKNIFFTMTQVFFQIFDFASGLTYNNQWVTSAFNVVVTSASPLLYGIFERDLDEATIVRFPSVYASNRDRKSFSLRTAMEYIFVYGLWHAFVVFFGVYLLFGYIKIGFVDGKDSGLVLVGLANSTIIVLMSLFKMMLDSHTLNWIVLLAVVLSLAMYVAVIPLSIHLSFIREYRLEGQLEMLFSSPTFYMVAAVIFVAGFLIDFGVMLIRQVFKPDVVSRLQQWERVQRQQKK